MAGESSPVRKAAFLVGIVFLLGAALGGVLGYNFGHEKASAAPPPMTDAQKRAVKVQHLTQELNLTPDQQKKMDAVIAEIQVQYKQIHESTEPQFEQARQKGRAEIRAFLTPEQLPKFEAFIKRLDEERQRKAQGQK